jgi:hypothetical protein
LRLLGLLLLISGLLRNDLAGRLPVLPLRPQNSEGFSETAPQAVATRRVNVPYEVSFSEAAIFWFGRVTPTENAADVRVIYREEELYVRVGVFDRRLWYDKTPSPEDLTAWDATSLYLDTDGPVGEAPDAGSYRFEAQLVWWEPRDGYDAAYVGDGLDWAPAAVPFTTSSGWRGNAPNDDVDDRGWVMAYTIPWQSLGLSGPPAEGTEWGLAVAVHDRDEVVVDTPIADQVWPETMDPDRPATWGELAFGLPSYEPLPSVPGGTTTVRHGVDSAVVVDADVGGSSTCGSLAWPDFFSTWGDLNYAGKTLVNIQNLADICDWPCYSRYYVTFPLDTVPAGKVITSATLTLYHNGNAGAGEDPGPQPSLIQAFSIDEGWDEAEITWNNSPLAVQNLGGTWVYPVEEAPPWPGIPYDWDVSLAAAEAYAAGEPLRLALYEADWAIHSGKYFFSSDISGAEARPMLRVTWGEPLAAPQKAAVPQSGADGDPIAYRVSFYGTGQSLALTDTLSSEVSPPREIQAEGTEVIPEYDPGCHCLVWEGAPPQGHYVRLLYRVLIETPVPEVLVNMVELSEFGRAVHTATALVLANPHRVFLPKISGGAKP